MSKLGAVLSIALGLSACVHLPAAEWRNFYYTTGMFEVTLRESPLGDCVLATGDRILLERLKSRSDVGFGQFLVERLPAPAKPPAPAAGVIIEHQFVLIRGIPVQPQCDQDYMYWLRDFRMVRSE